MLGIGVNVRDAFPLESIEAPMVPRPAELSRFAYSAKKMSYGFAASTKLSTTTTSDN